MIDREANPPRCIGYAGFLERHDPGFRRWFARLEREVVELANGPNRRILELQHALVDLIRELDPGGMRYPDEVLRKV
jgi:hypothetical protein